MKYSDNKMSIGELTEFIKKVAANSNDSEMFKIDGEVLGALQKISAAQWEERVEKFGELCKALQNNKHVEELEIDFVTCGFTMLPEELFQEVINLIAKVITRNISIKVLSIKNFFVCRAIKDLTDNVHAKKIFDSLQNNTGINVFRLDIAGMELHETQYLVSALGKNKSIKELQLTQLHPLHDQKIFAVLMGNLGVSENIQFLDLSKNNITNQDVDNLLENAKGRLQCNLSSVDFSLNTISAVKLVALLEALVENKNLREIKLDWSDIDDSNLQDSSRSKAIIFSLSAILKFLQAHHNAPFGIVLPTMDKDKYSKGQILQQITNELRGKIEHRLEIAYRNELSKKYRAALYKDFMESLTTDYDDMKKEMNKLYIVLVLKMEMVSMYVNTLSNDKNGGQSQSFVNMWRNLASKARKDFSNQHKNKAHSQVDSSRHSGVSNDEAALYEEIDRKLYSDFERELDSNKYKKEKAALEKIFEDSDELVQKKIDFISWYVMKRPKEEEDIKVLWQKLQQKAEVQQENKRQAYKKSTKFKKDVEDQLKKEVHDEFKNEMHNLDKHLAIAEDIVKQIKKNEKEREGQEKREKMVITVFKSNIDENLMYLEQIMPEILIFIEEISQMDTEVLLNNKGNRKVMDSVRSLLNKMWFEAREGGKQNNMKVSKDIEVVEKFTNFGKSLAQLKIAIKFPSSVTNILFQTVEDVTVQAVQGNKVFSLDKARDDMKQALSKARDDMKQVLSNSSDSENQLNRLI
jgi:hypothetical protein